MIDGAKGAIIILIIAFFIVVIINPINKNNEIDSQVYISGDVSGKYVDMDSSYVIGGFTTEYWNDSCWFKIDSSYTVITIYNPNITVIWDTFKARSF